MTEEWRVIQDFPDYAVSDVGRVKRIVPDQKGRLSNKPMNPTRDSDGYLQVNLFKNAKATTRKVHKLVCEAFHGLGPSPRHEVAHGDGNQVNNHKRNLRWATGKENAHDRDRHGRTARGARHPSKTKPGYLPTGDKHWSRKNPSLTTKGESHGCAKLTETDVVAIRSDCRKGRDIAVEYGISTASVSQIRTRKTWRHVA